MTPQGRRYDTLWERLIANTADPENEQACWVWTGSKCSGYGYGRTNLYVPPIEYEPNPPLNWDEPG